MAQMNLLELEPQKVSTDLRTYTSMLYGPPKVGKTSFYFELFGQDAIFARTEKGSKAIPGLFGQDIASWADFIQFKSQLRRPEVREKFKVVVIDTYDNLCIYLEKYIKSKYEVNKLNDANGGWGAGQSEFTEVMLMTLNEIESFGYTIHFISHSTTKTETIPGPNGEDVEITKYIPATKKRGMEVATKMVDNLIFGYLGVTPEGKETRVLYTRDTLKFQAGTRFKQIKTGIPFSAKNYQEAVNEAIAFYGEENLKDESEGNAMISQEHDFEEMMKEAKTIAVKMHEAKRMDEVTALIEMQLGKDKLLRDLKPAQVETLYVILEEMRKFNI